MSLSSTDGRTCPIHGNPLHLRRQGAHRPLRWECRPCRIEEKRLYRARQRTRVCRTGVPKLLRAEAARVLSRAEDIARRCGGWQRLIEALPPGQAAQLVLKFASAHDELKLRADESEAFISEAARDRATIAAAVELLLQLPPSELSPIIHRLIIRARDRRAILLCGNGDGV